MLGGSRLTKFMETVEAASASIPAAVAEEPQDALVAPDSPNKRRRRSSSVDLPNEDDAPSDAAIHEATNRDASAGEVLSGLMQVGLKLLESLAAPRNGSASPIIEHDAATGRSTLKIPLPETDTLDQALTAVQALLQRLRG